jgi:hypothetical protein
MTRFWADGTPVTVTCADDRRPAWITWQHRRERVIDILGRWRVDEGWWRARVWREYLVLVTERGRLLLIYRDLLDDRWYVQRLYD